MVILALVDIILPQLVRYSIDHLILKKSTKGLVPFTGAFLLAGASVAALVYAMHYYAAEIEYHITTLLRNKAFRHLQVLPFSFYDKTPTGYMMSRLTSDINMIGEVIAWSIVDIIWGILLMVLVVIVMLSVNLKLALICLSIIPLLVIVSAYFQQKILYASRFARKVRSYITSAFNEGILGAKTTKSLVSENAQYSEFESLTSLYQKKSLRLVHFTALYTPIIVVIGGISLALVLNFGGIDVTRGIITIGTLNLFIAYSVQFFMPMRRLASLYGELQSTQASVERILELINAPLEIKDDEAVIQTYGDVFEPKRENWEDFSGNITFKDVSFHYVPEEPVIEGFNLDVKAGQTVAFVGETGSGKSTLVNLACRFYEPISGQILFDGVDYKERSQLWVQDKIGYVLQTPHLFSGTIKDNILFGKPDATEDELIAACKITNAYDFILRLEKGFDTEVGEGGGKLSAGERQLISFARAMIKNPKLFVLDEATSSVDTHTEKLIQDAIDHVLTDRTSFIIAHRLSTIQSADVIIVLKNGKAVESGTHASLMAEKGYYHDLYTHNFFSEEV